MVIHSPIWLSITIGVTATCRFSGRERGSETTGSVRRKLSFDDENFKFLPTAFLWYIWGQPPSRLVYTVGRRCPSLLGLNATTLTSLFSRACNSGGRVFNNRSTSWGEMDRWEQMKQSQKSKFNFILISIVVSPLARERNVLAWKFQFFAHAQRIDEAVPDEFFHARIPQNTYK